MIKSNRGFTLAETIVTLAVMITIAAVVTPALGGYLDVQRIERARASLEYIGRAVYEFDRDLTRYPRTLQQLSYPPAATDLHLCDKQIGPGLADKWKGPYIDRLVPATGLALPVGIARNQLVRDPNDPNDSKWGVAKVLVDDVDLRDAIDLNALIDGDGSTEFGAAHNAVRWAPFDGSARVTLEYVVPVSPCKGT